MSNPFPAILLFTALAIVIILAWAEQILAAEWTKFYFTSGVLVFWKQVSIESRHSNPPSPSLLEKRLSSCLMGSLTFKELESNQYGFREKLFSFALHLVTHGLIVFDTENNLITVKGYLNWVVISLITFLSVIYPFLLLISGTPRTEFLNDFILSVVGCVWLFGIPYLIDRFRLKIIAATAAELWSRKYILNYERA